MGKQIKIANLEQFGEFNCKTGVLRVADGCYNPDVWCIGFLTHVKTGKWLAFKEMADDDDWGIRVKRITVIHEEVYQEIVKKKSKTLTLSNRLPETIGVDAGMAGFMDAGYLTHPDKTYEKICEGILNDARCYADKSCAITESGYGDGSYVCHYKGSKGKGIKEQVSAACITFL